ncbi:1195_t:CDS:2 [Paraglomus occultum]|uniref:1195_t:CDS:1 n=1 Tax=Paraglomus occultum TaxID=144539 RepID=A0A9N9A333_9GLOM|nr:1195_t:CDS:2 [Paraglomus occultum]
MPRAKPANRLFTNNVRELGIGLRIVWHISKCVGDGKSGLFKLFAIGYDIQHPRRNKTAQIIMTSENNPPKKIMQQNTMPKHLQPRTYLPPWLAIRAAIRFAMRLTMPLAILPAARLTTRLAHSQIKG